MHIGASGLFSSATEPIINPMPEYIEDAAVAGYETDEDFLATARDRFKLCAESESEYRSLCLEDLRFYDGDQWPQNIESQRTLDRRPCLTINRLPGSVHQVTNEIRKDKPSPDISPVDDQGDIETAEVLQGLIRHIEQQSNAPAVRSYASFYSVVTGRGYYRITTDYTEPMAFDQEIYIRRIKNPATVYMDPACNEQDCSDAEWCFIVSDLTQDKHNALRKKYGKEVASAENFRSTGDSDPLWRWEGGVRIAEYFCRHLEQVQIAMLGDGSVVPLDQVPEGMPVMATRTTEIPRVQWSLIDGAEVLERRDWPGQWIPVIPVYGEEYDIDGKQKLVGMVRNAKDPQRMLNYWESAKTELIALAPRTPYIVAEGQLENHEQEWAQANSRNFAYVQYKVKEVGGNLVPPPQRQVYEPPVQAITIAQQQTIDHLKATTNVYDASLGNRSNETTGIAIRSRQAQGDTANYHYKDNLAIAVTHESRILIDLIPKIYDRPGRVARIIGEDGSGRNVTLNQPFDQGGAMKIYDLQAGRYDVVVGIGPSYATKRQESADSMLGFAQAAPELVPRYADLFVKAMDWPGAQEIAARVRPPDLPPEDETPIPPQAQAQMSQLQQQNQQLAAENQQLMQIIQGKQVEAESKERMQQQQIASDERIAAEKNQTTLVGKYVDTDSADSTTLLMAELRNLEMRIKQIQAREALQAKMEQLQAQNEARLQQTDMQNQAKLQQAEMQAQARQQGPQV